jgi:hypothetical protein
MLWSLQETLGFIEPCLPRALLPDGAWPAILGTARKLPEAVSLCGLECHLGKDVARVDFLACVLASSPAPERWATFCEDKAREGDTDSAGWRALWRFASEWAHPAALLHRQIPFIWLEFDEPALRPDAAPSQLCCLNPAPLAKPPARAPVSRDDRPEVHLRVIEESLARVLDGPVSAKTRATLSRCFEHLPPGGAVAHLSVMRAREPAALKLTVCLPRDGLEAYLAAVGWPGSASGLRAVLETFSPDAHSVTLDLSMGDVMALRIGLEFFDARDQARDPARQALLDNCLRAGLCTREQRDALRTWAGSNRHLYAGDGWPTRVSRWMDVKLVQPTDGALTAKVYLGVQPHFSLA